MLTGSGPLYQPPLSEDQRNGQIEVMHRFTITAWGKMAAVPEPERWIAIADGTIAPPSYLITQNRGVWCSAWSGPPCWELLNNPVAVMTHPDRWPMHLCHDVLKESTRRFNDSRKPAGLVERAIGNEWPYPIGTSSFYKHASSARTLLKDDRVINLPPEAPLPRNHPAHSGRFLPFARDEYAVLVLTADIHGTIVDWFGLANEAAVPDDSGGSTYFALSGSEHRISGPEPTSPDVDQFLDAATKWWQTFQGQHLRPGRPKGHAITADQLIAEFTALREKAGRAPTQEALADALNTSRQNLRKLLKEYRLAWPRSRNGMLTAIL